MINIVNFHDSYKKPLLCIKAFILRFQSGVTSYSSVINAAAGAFYQRANAFRPINTTNPILPRFFNEEDCDGLVKNVDSPVN